jgi:hypothetical protein
MMKDVARKPRELTNMSFWTTGLIIIAMIWISLGFGRLVSRRELQHQQIINMLNTLYATQMRHGPIMANVQNDLAEIRTRLGIQDPDRYIPRLAPE